MAINGGYNRIQEKYPVPVAPQRAMPVQGQGEITAMTSPRIPPLVADLVQNAILLFDDREFSGIPCCPSCGGVVRGYDMKRKRFAVLPAPGRNQVVTVRVKRFVCRDCGALCYADEPFYPDTRAGSPVVDLSRVLGAAMPATRAAVYLGHLGVVVDRGSVRKYVWTEPAGTPSVEIFGMRLPRSLLQLSSLAARAGSGECVRTPDILSACGYPAVRGNVRRTPREP